jgi:hypothetical protein
MFKILRSFLLKKNIKCNIWKVAVRPSYILDARFLKVNIEVNIYRTIVLHIVLYGCET